MNVILWTGIFARVDYESGTQQIRLARQLTDWLVGWLVGSQMKVIHQIEHSIWFIPQLQNLITCIAPKNSYSNSIWRIVTAVPLCCLIIARNLWHVECKKQFWPMFKMVLSAVHIIRLAKCESFSLFAHAVRLTLCSLSPALTFLWLNHSCLCARFAGISNYNVVKFNQA